MSKLLQYLVNKPSVQHKVLPGLRKMQMAGQYNAERDATSVNTPVLSKMFGAQREVDVNRFSEDAFKQKYNMTPHQYKMKTDSDYAQAFQRQMDDRRQNDPNYSELNLPATDVRSKLYRGNPNLALIPKGATGQARAQQEQLFADMTSLSAPLLPVKSLVRGLQVGKAASAAPKIIDKLISAPSPVRTAATQSVNNSGLFIDDDLYRKLGSGTWRDAWRRIIRNKVSLSNEQLNAVSQSWRKVPSMDQPLRSKSSTSNEAWGTPNWDASIRTPADNIQSYRPVWPGTINRNTIIRPLDLSSFAETGADRLIGATRKIDEKLGRLFSKATNPPVFDADEVTRLINENLSKGLGVKKENLGLQVRNSPLPYDLETGFRIETLIDNNKVGSILFQRNMNPYKPKKLSQILLDKLPTPFDRWRNTPGFKKTNDFPFAEYDVFNPIKDPTGKTFNTANDLYRTGISGEFNKAVNEALKAKGLGNVLSGGTGHSALGQARWEKLVEKGLAEDLGDGYYKLKKQGGPVVDPRGQWAHPGKRTIVPTPTGRITMQGVPYPVYGQDETGFGQMMYPGGEYKFPGQMVDEMPMMRNGGGLLSKSVTCSNCGWSWKAVEGGSDPLTCHKCGGTVKMQLGGLLQPITAQDMSNVLSLFSVPQKAITKLLTGKYQTPSEAMDIKNPYGAFAADAVLDPVNLVGAGLLGKMAKASTKTGLLSNTYKINPWRFKPKEGMMYRGLGQEGLDDALESGVLRPKQYNFPEKRSLAERVESPKQFGTTYYAPAKKFDVVSNYGDGYVAEVPFEGNLFNRRYGRKDWSWSTPKQISIEEAKLLEKDWLKGYKEVKLPNKSVKNSTSNLVDLYRVQESGAKTFNELATEGKIPKWFNNPQTLARKAEEEKYFGQWFTKDKTDLDWYIKDREFTNPEIIKLQVPESELSKFSQYDKSLSRAPEREFVIPYEQQKLYKQNYKPNKKNGGQHGGLDRWFAEKWVDVKTGKACGRQEGEKRAGYPACRPSKRVSSETPKTSSEMSSAEKAKFKRTKTSSERIPYNHKK